MTERPQVIGLLPAAGLARRLGPLPLSKEIYPVGFDARSDTPRVASEFVLHSMKLAGIETAFFVLRKGKWDIAEYFGDGTSHGMRFGYLLMGLPDGVPYTLDQARPFVAGQRVALGFPDILFEPADAFSHLLQRQSETGAAVVLGLFPCDRPQKMDMVRIDVSGQVVEIQIKPDSTDLRYTWSIAVWTPVFTDFLHNFLVDRKRSSRGREAELYVGEVFQAAIAVGLDVRTVCFPGGRSLDMGTPDDLRRVIREHLDP